MSGWEGLSRHPGRILGCCPTLHMGEALQDLTTALIFLRLGRVVVQIEEFDAELEAMSGQKGKKGAKAPPRQQHLDDSIARHRQHITRLEQMLRLLDNDAISVRLQIWEIICYNPSGQAGRYAAGSLIWLSPFLAGGWSGRNLLPRLAAGKTKQKFPCRHCFS